MSKVLIVIKGLLLVYTAALFGSAGLLAIIYGAIVPGLVCLCFFGYLSYRYFKFCEKIR